MRGGGMGEGEKGKRGRENIKKGGWKEKKGEGLKGGKKKKKKKKRDGGESGHRSRYLSHAKRALYHLS